MYCCINPKNNKKTNTTTNKTQTIQQKFKTTHSLNSLASFCFIQRSFKTSDIVFLRSKVQLARFLARVSTLSLNPFGLPNTLNTHIIPSKKIKPKTISIFLRQRIGNLLTHSFSHSFCFFDFFA